MIYGYLYQGNTVTKNRTTAESDKLAPVAYMSHLPLTNVLLICKQVNDEYREVVARPRYINILLRRLQNIIPSLNLVNGASLLYYYSWS